MFDWIGVAFHCSSYFVINIWWYSYLECVYEIFYLTINELCSFPFIYLNKLLVIWYGLRRSHFIYLNK